MHIILGAAGHIGSILAKRLLENKEAVTVVLHRAEQEAYWKQMGAQVAILDVLHTEDLQKLFQTGKRLFLLNPPASPDTDTVAKEFETLSSILDALQNVEMEKVVGASTYGAQYGKAIGDLGVLYEMEQALFAQSIPNSIIRSAYYMSNWDQSLESAKEEGVVHTLYPVDFKLPMVAPADIAALAADLMLEPMTQTGLHFVEGPELYSAADVAAAFENVLKRPVKAVSIPEDQWETSLISNGFSEKAATAMAAMTNITLEGLYTKSELPYRGVTTIQQYVADLVRKNESANKHNLIHADSAGKNSTE